MNDLPEEAVIAAAKAIFEHSLPASWDAEQKSRHWLQDAADYREIARVALEAGLPYLRHRAAHSE
jgi:hypothetical protein